MSEPARMTLTELIALVSPNKESGESVELEGVPPDIHAPITFWFVRIYKVISGAVVRIEAGPNDVPQHAVAMAAERYRTAWDAR